jgi:hypothetical protein
VAYLILYLLPILSTHGAGGGGGEGGKIKLHLVKAKSSICQKPVIISLCIYL